MKLHYVWQHMKQETSHLMKKIEILEASKRFKILNFYSSFTNCLHSMLNYAHSQRMYLHVYFSFPRKLLGEGLGSCSLEELQQIEQQLEKSVSNVRARKVRLTNIFNFCHFKDFKFDKYLNPNFQFFRLRFTRNKLSN